MALNIDGLASKVDRNIRLTYVYTMLINAQLDRGIWMLFLSYRGLGLVQIGLVESVYQLSYLMLGVPAGAIGDLIGRKTSLFLSIVAKVLSYALILVSSDFAGYAASFMLGAASAVLYSSSLESISYESSVIAGRGNDYKKIYGNVLALAFISAALGIAVGGLIAADGYENAYYASMAIMLLALVPGFLFAETKGIVGRAKRRPGMLGLFAGSLKAVANNPLVLYLLVLFGAISAADMTIYMYCQKYFQSMAIPVFAIGIILGIDSLFAAFAARYAYVLARLPARSVIVVIPAVIFGAYALLAVLDSPLVVPLMWLGTVFVVAFWPILSELVNRRIPSENRATVLALKGQVSSAAVMVLFPVVGLFAERTSLSLAFLWLLVTLAPLAAYSVIKIRGSVFLNL